MTSGSTGPSEFQLVQSFSRNQIFRNGQKISFGLVLTYFVAIFKCTCMHLSGACEALPTLVTALPLMNNISKYTGMVT